MKRNEAWQSAGPHFALVKRRGEAFNRGDVPSPQQAGRRRTRHEERERQARRAGVGRCDHRRVGVLRCARRLRVPRGWSLGGRARGAHPAAAGSHRRAKCRLARRPNSPRAAPLRRDAARGGRLRRVGDRGLWRLRGRRLCLRRTRRDFLDADTADAPGTAPVPDPDAGGAGRVERRDLDRREPRDAGRPAGRRSARRAGEGRSHIRARSRGIGRGRRRDPPCPHRRAGDRPGDVARPPSPCLAHGGRARRGAGRGDADGGADVRPWLSERAHRGRRVSVAARRRWHRRHPHGGDRSEPGA